MKVMHPLKPPTYRIMCMGCKDWLPADRPGVRHDGEACVERCAAVFECPREAEQAAIEAGWSLEERALCPACRARTLPMPGGAVEFPLQWSAGDVARWKAEFDKPGDDGERLTRFEAGRVYRPKFKGYEQQQVTVVAANKVMAIGWWWDGDPWHRGQESRGDWEEVQQ